MTTFSPLNTVRKLLAEGVPVPQIYSAMEAAGLKRAYTSAVLSKARENPTGGRPATYATRKDMEPIGEDYADRYRSANEKASLLHLEDLRSTGRDQWPGRRIPPDQSGRVSNVHRPVSVSALGSPAAMCCAGTPSTCLQGSPRKRSAS